MANIPASNRVVGASDNIVISSEALREEHNELEQAVAKFEKQAERVPARIADEKIQGEWQDCIKEIDDLGKRIESERERVKSPFLTMCGVVDGVFKSLYEKSTRGTPGRLNKARTKIAASTDDFLARKEREERMRREEEAARAREEQCKAEEVQRKAQEAARKAEDEERTRAAANQQRKADDAAADASVASARAYELEQQAKAKPADLSRTRSEGGTLGTLKLSWDFECLDIEAVRGAQLWAFVSHDAKKKAIAAYIRANAPSEIADGDDWQPIVGVRMIQKRSGQYR